MSILDTLKQFLFFLPAFWLLHGQLWPIVKGKTTVTRCYLLRPIYVWPEGHRKSRNEAGSLSLDERLLEVECRNWWNYVRGITNTSLWPFENAWKVSAWKVRMTSKSEQQRGKLENIVTLQIFYLLIYWKPVNFKLKIMRAGL